MRDPMPELLCLHYSPKGKRRKKLLPDILKMWKGVPHRPIEGGKKATGYRIAKSLNEILFEYIKDQKPIDVKDYRNLKIEDRLGYEKVLRKDGFLYLILTMRNRQELVRKRREDEKKERKRNETEKKFGKGIGMMSILVCVHS
jgi:hypothetical protein